jgi:hypothetical protein
VGEYVPNCTIFHHSTPGNAGLGLVMGCRPLDIHSDFHNDQSCADGWRLDAC